MFREDFCDNHLTGAVDALGGGSASLRASDGFSKYLDSWCCTDLLPLFFKLERSMMLNCRMMLLLCYLQKMC